MKESVKNGLRSAVVVIGALAFGHLTLKLAFLPYLEKTQQEMEALQNQQAHSSETSESSNEQFDDSHILMSDEGFTNLDDS